MQNHFTILLMFICFSILNTAVAQNKGGDKVSYPTGIRLLVDSSACSDVVWNTYSNDLAYAQITVDLKYCQQFADYQLPAGSSSGSGTWGKGSKPGDGSVLLGHHFELVKQQEVFVQTLASGGSKDQVEKQVQLQCRDWLSRLPVPEPSDKIPAACK